MVGATEKTVCDECKHVREEKRIKQFHRFHEIIADSTQCLFDQGIICAGPATRGGCGALCTKVDIPCRGCYGPPPHVDDQGAALLSAVASVVDADTEEEAAASSARSPTRSARSTGSACPRRCCIGRRLGT